MEAKRKLSRKVEEDRITYNTLKAKLLAGGVLTEAEKQTFCTSIMVGGYDDTILEDYECCKEYKVWNLYLTYHRDLSGGLIYYKINRLKLAQVAFKSMSQSEFEYDNVDFKNIPIDDYMDVVPRDEVDKDLQYLYNAAKEWEPIVAKNNHKEDLLKAITVEARKELKLLNDSVADDPFANGKFKYKNELRTIMLRFRYFYRLAKIILETYSPSDFIINIIGQSVYVTSESIIHILNRHFAKITSLNFVFKTYHNEDIDPRNFHVLLKEIFETINSSFDTTKLDLNRIMFKYKNTVYLLFTVVKKSHIKGGKPYRQLSTFYPILLDEVRKEIRRGYKPYQLKDNLSIYSNN